jgi:predicted dehydrogenase
VRCAIKAGELVREGRIGRVVQTLGLGPHREGDRAHLAGGEGRPEWFYDHNRTGGIITDIASHQIDQFLWFTGAEKAEIVSSTVANYTYQDSPKMQDFGEVALRSDGAHGYVRVDWYTPQGLPTWGDGRLVILGRRGWRPDPWARYPSNRPAPPSDGLVEDRRRARRADSSSR